MPTNHPEDQAVTPSSGKLIPPSHEVDVPNLPKKPDEGKNEAEIDKIDQARDQGGHTPADVDHSHASWADSTQPAPDKRNARTSIL